MNTGKKINVNISSLVGLKAELLRKHTEIKDAQNKYDPDRVNLPQVKVKTKKVKVKKEKDAKGSKTTEIEDINELKKSKYMLEAKSRLYDKLKVNRGDEDHHYLVDFQNKIEESENELDNEDEYEDRNSDPEEDWVDYEDCFGRSRKCLRRDLPKMREKDNLIKREITKEPPEDTEHRAPPPPVFVPPPKVPEIEIMRKKWEEQEEKLTHKSEIHYQDILFDEARDHGVGYYAFSHDEEKRHKQQADLAKLRKETEQRQKKMQEINEAKAKMEQNRLRIARIRQRVRAGLPPEPEEEEEAPQPTDKVEPEPSQCTEPDEEVKTDEDSLSVIEDKIKAFGELLGKRPQWRELTQEEWVHKRRKDRHGEFAPVYDNFKSGGHLKATKNNQMMKREGDEDDPLGIPMSGPEPTDLWESAGPAHLDDNESEKEPDKLQSFHEIDSLLEAGSSKISSSAAAPQLETPTIGQEKSEQSSNESDSDGSDIIGPMPPVAIISDGLLSEIPLPKMPPPEQSANLNDKITAGLKFLREKFDKSPGS